LEGYALSKLIIISNGTIKLSKSTYEGKEQIIHILSVGEFFGELSLFNDNYITNFSAVAVNDVRICVISKSNMDIILSKNPHITLKILNEVSKRLMETENLAACLATNDVDHRIICMILEFVDKYGVNKNGVIHVDIPLNREGMASYCGITRETISRKLSKFEQDGLFEFESMKKLIVKDLEKMKNFMN
jgi:CRP/FNR family transcriptional regulator